MAEFRFPVAGSYNTRADQTNPFGAASGVVGLGVTGTTDLKAHEEEHCVEFNIPKQNWTYTYTEDSFSICSKAVGGIAEGCAISDGQTCKIILPKELESQDGK